MRIGLIADTHDNLIQTDKAVDCFNQHRVDYVLHAGDFVAPFTVARFKNLRCEFSGVFGNNDGEKDGLVKVSGSRIHYSPLNICQITANMIFHTDRLFVLVQDILWHYQIACSEKKF